ncbi:MAG TPA: [NiFe]-hydrogenase assembly chaperone HybE [Pelomicrobium sp.]|nr:[NiFe]-hydrogenase assembly chaperone HybE [Pelomicrobium sp.]
MTEAAAAHRAGYAQSPGPRLEAAFRRIRDERMRDVPILNPRVEVEAVGFRVWEGRWLGILITPWFMNVMLLPREGGPWIDVAPGAEITWRFPAGDYLFLGGREEAAGDYQMCSLFSPMLEFEDHAAARATAEACLELLLQPDAAAEPPEGPVATIRDNVARPMSKREFLSGAVLRRRDEG